MSHVTLCVCHAGLKSYLLTYLPAGETSWGRTGEVRNVHKSFCTLQCLDRPVVNALGVVKLGKLGVK